MSHLIKVFIEGMGSMTILTPEDANRASKRLDPNDYIHRSAEAALKSDWQTVGGHLIKAAKNSRVQDKIQ